MIRAVKAAMTMPLEQSRDACDTLPYQLQITTMNDTDDAYEVV
ncbi:hypothetical protein [Alicyclobacillus sp. SO9]|nr:hypothetical protein [Alicyclobacillus sp. SO9]